MICKGKILDLIPITDEVIQVVIQVKKNETFFPVAFIAFKDIKILINQVKMEKGDVVKIDEAMLYATSDTNQVIPFAHICFAPKFNLKP